MNKRTLVVASMAVLASVLPACGSSQGSSGGDAGAVTYPPTASSTGCKATVTQGAMSGKLAGSTCEYLGIQYGTADRFMPPKAAGAFKTTPLDATAYGPMCPQSGQGAALLGGSGAAGEDCLYLNVFTPRAAPTKPLPVMVFIYGGAFDIGSSNTYDGQPLSEKGPVVLVTLNYRLGALGFLALPELDAMRPGAPSGSDGLRDQQLALKWVKDNIATFHGDPTNVTVFGESAGSMSTCIHIVSPGSQGLAKRYIMESVACVGGGEAVNAQSQAYAVGHALASSLCSGGDGGASDAAVADPVGCLRAAAVDQITSWEPAPGAIPPTPSGRLLGNLLGPPFGPTVEGAGGVLPDTPANLIAAGKFNASAQVIAGTNLNEFGLFVSLATNPLFGGSASSQLNITTAAQLQQGLVTSYGSAAAALVESQYGPITDANAQQTLIDIITDYAFRCPTRQLAKMLQAKGAADYYLYSYDVGKAYHAFELVPLFNLSMFSLLGATNPSSAYTQTMLGYWTQFATTGNPSPAGDGGAPAWPTNVVGGSDEYMQLVDPTPVVKKGLAKSNCDFWATLPPSM